MNDDQLTSLGFVTQTQPEPVRAVAKININQKPVEMTSEDKNWITDQFKALAKKFAGKAKALLLQDATGVTVEFPDLADDATPSIGDMATVDGAPANGVYVMPSLNNASVTFVDGLVTEIT
ncbi:hypothetical protein RZS08_43700, partial [Arthrospira platensis SPKY1]|nr:hypothetical protein [Arthrospira platensis SPKY1]